jgi:hypothetical protein
MARTPASNQWANQNHAWQNTHVPSIVSKHENTWQASKQMQFITCVSVSEAS